MKPLLQCIAKHPVPEIAALCYVLFQKKSVTHRDISTTSYYKPSGQYSVTKLDGP